MNLNQTPFDGMLSETLKIRRPDSRKPFGRDIRGSFNAFVVRQQFSADDSLGITFTDSVFRIAIDEALPIEPQDDSTLPNFERDLQEDDQLIRLKFYTADEIDTEAKLRNAKKGILQVLSIESFEKAQQMLLITKEL